MPSLNISKMPDKTRPIYDIDTTIIASPSSSETIISTSAVINSPELEHPNIVITNGITSVLIKGEYTDPFTDFFHYVDKGYSNNPENPGNPNLPGYPFTQEEKEAIRIPNMSPNKELYELVQDQTPQISFTFTVTVIYTTQ